MIVYVKNVQLSQCSLHGTSSSTSTADRKHQQRQQLEQRRNISYTFLQRLSIVTTFQQHMADSWYVPYTANVISADKRAMHR